MSNLSLVHPESETNPNPKRSSSNIPIVCGATTHRRVRIERRSNDLMVWTLPCACIQFIISISYSHSLLVRTFRPLKPDAIRSHPAGYGRYRDLRTVNYYFNGFAVRPSVRPFGWPSRRSSDVQASRGQPAGLRVWQLGCRMVYSVVLRQQAAQLPGMKWRWWDERGLNGSDLARKAWKGAGLLALLRGPHAVTWHSFTGS